MALVPTNVRGGVRPANPASGGHYIPVAGGFKLIHATGPGQWAAGPRPAKALPQKKAPATTAKSQPAANVYNTALYQPSQSLSGKPLAQYAQAVTNLKYNPTIDQLSSQIQQNTNQGAAAQDKTAGYFNQLGQYATDSANRVNAIGQGLNTQLADIGSGTQAALDKFGQAAATPALQTLADQGLGGGAPQQLANALAAQKLTIGQNAALDQAYGAKIGSNASTLAAQNLGTFALRGQERLGQIAAATRLAQKPLETQLGTTRANKAAAYVTNLQAARQQQVSNTVTQEGLTNKALATTSAANTAAANRAAANQRTAATIAGQNQRTQAGIDARAIQGGLDRKSRQDIAASNNSTRTAIASGKQSAAAGKPASPAAQRTIMNSITSVQGRLRWLIKTIGAWTGATPATTQTQAWHALRDGRIFAPYQAPVYDPKTKKPAQNSDGSPKTVQKWRWQTIPPVGDIGLLNAAYNTVIPGGGLSPGDVSYLHNMGFTIGGRLPIKQPNPTVSGGAGFGSTF